MSFRSRDQEARTTNHKQKTQTHATMTNQTTLGRPSHYHGLPSQPSNATQQHYTLLFITTFPRALFAGSRQYQLGVYKWHSLPHIMNSCKMAQGSSRESISSIELGSYTHRIARRGIGAITNATIFNGNGQELIK